MPDRTDAKRDEVKIVPPGQDSVIVDMRRHANDLILDAFRREAEAQEGGGTRGAWIAAGPDENGWDCRCGARRISLNHYPNVCPACGVGIRFKIR